MKTIDEYFDEFMHKNECGLPEKMHHMVKVSFVSGFASCFDCLLNDTLRGPKEDITAKLRMLQNDLLNHFAAETENTDTKEDSHGKR